MKKSGIDHCWSPLIPANTFPIIDQCIKINGKPEINLHLKKILKNHLSDLKFCLMSHIRGFHSFAKQVLFGPYTFFTVEENSFGGINLPYPMRRYNLNNLFLWCWNTKTTKMTILIPSTIIHDKVHSVKKYEDSETIKQPA